MNDNGSQTDRLTEVTAELLETGVADDFGALYSPDGKFLIIGNSCETDIYYIKEGTEIICDFAFSDSEVNKVVIPSTVTAIGAIPFERNRIDEIESNSSRFVVQDGMLIDLQEDRLVSYVGKAKKVVVPDSIRMIGDSAFAEEGVNDGSITTVVLPANLTCIGDCAFEGCECLESINLPSTLTTIGNGVFAGCYSLPTDFTIPASVVNMGDNPFAFMNNIQSDSSRFIVMDNLLIDTMDGRLVTCFGDEKHVVLPNMVKYIGTDAFEGGPSVATIVIPSWIEGLEKAGFWDYKCFEKAIIPKECMMKFKEMLPEKLWGKLDDGTSSQESDSLSHDESNPSFFKRIIRLLLGC